MKKIKVVKYKYELEKKDIVLIRKCCKKYNYGYKDLASYVGVSLQHFKNIMTLKDKLSDNTYPKFKKLMKLVKKGKLC